ncbi:MULTISPECIES: DUF397 domain-containing protein [Kitasatospora]|uniref:DUF397 domain-containing protein n=1 Tax=Kitasatospora setae (strain ATCC 33774 / DSM 43861 / JCM 3304 / KCC A-0304 / NBRC 14216 / KM-6054) TaxID=452652 RepID=E4N762_KITSK|nr:MULTISPECIES: DUF397 domain-containing protein [Kitasatospora]BAJ27043.1 hypothetical protein KSE_12100 [Kitasatospora setae KM-6054]
MPSTIDLHGVQWVKSSRSGNGGNCVEAALGAHAAVMPVRDSKDPMGAVLLFPTAAWSAFVTAAAGEFGEV